MADLNESDKLAKQNFAQAIAVDAVVADVEDAFEENVQFLKQLGYPTGLARAVLIDCKGISRRYWVVDNSGSMRVVDGKRLEPREDGNYSVQSCSRWHELQDTIRLHVDIAAKFKIYSNFRLLNFPESEIKRKFTVSTRSTSDLHQEVETARRMMSSEPRGKTPIVKRLKEIRDEIEEVAERLRHNGEKLLLVIATDGKPTDEKGNDGENAKRQLTSILKELEIYPIWIIIRICSNDDEIIGYYNDIDAQFERSLEVLDDVYGEGKEISKVNKWLNYALPLHWSREMGFRDRLFDLIDERALTQDEMIKFCELLFGVDPMRNLPDPYVEWPKFVEELSKIVELEGNVWNPLKKNPLPWIDMKELDKKYNPQKSRSSLGKLKQSFKRSMRKLG